MWLLFLLKLFLWVKLLLCRENVNWCLNRSSPLTYNCSYLIKRELRQDTYALRRGKLVGGRARKTCPDGAPQIGVETVRAVRSKLQQVAQSPGGRDRVTER